MRTLATLVGLSAFMIMLPACEPGQSNASSGEAPAPPVALELPRRTEADRVIRSYERYVEYLTDGRIEHARKRIVAPRDIWLEQQLANALRQTGRHLEEGRLELEAGEAELRGRWAVIEVTSRRTAGPDVIETVVPVFMVRDPDDEDTWRIAPEAIHADEDVAALLDEDFEALGAWFLEQHPPVEPVAVEAPDDAAIAALIAQADLAPRDVLGGNLTMLAPSAFGPMTDAMLRLKYPSSRAPQEVLTDEDGSVNIALSHTATPVQIEHLDGVRRAIELQMRQSFPNAEWLSNEMIEINGRPFFRLDLRTPAIDVPVRNAMVGTVSQRRLVLVTFNCTVPEEDTWMPVADAILDSIQVHR